MIGKRETFCRFNKKTEHRQSKIIAPVSLSSVCQKKFERLIFDSSFNFMIRNNLLNSFQSGFGPNDFCVNQLISVTHNVHLIFDANPSLGGPGVFLDLSKTSD